MRRTPKILAVATVMLFLGSEFVYANSISNFFTKGSGGKAAQIFYKTKILPVGRSLKNIPSNAKANCQSIYKSALLPVGRAFKNVPSNARANCGSIRNFFGSVPHTIVKAFKNAPSNARANCKAIYETIKDFKFRSSLPGSSMIRIK